MPQRVVMVLSGGGVKCAAHVGAARALRDAGIVPIHWIGTSLGAVFAAALAAGEDPDAILERFLSVKRAEVLVPMRFAGLRGLWNRALLRPEPLQDTVRRLLSVDSFAALQVACTVTAVNVATGDEVAFGSAGIEAPLLDALAASYALPPYYPPHSVHGVPYYDGGLRAVVPLGIAARIPCDRVIAIDVGPGFDEVGDPIQVPPPLVATTDTAQGWLMAGTTRLLRERWMMEPELPPLTWLRPVTDRGATFAVERAATYAQLGHDAMRDALARDGFR